MFIILKILVIHAIVYTTMIRIQNEGLKLPVPPVQINYDIFSALAEACTDAITMVFIFLVLFFLVLCLLAYHLCWSLVVLI